MRPLKREQLMDQIIEYSRYAQEDDQDDDAWNTIGVCNLSLGRISCAKQPLLKALKLQPKNSAFWYNVGLMYDKSGKKELAVRLYTGSLELNPRNSYPLYNLSIHYMHNGWFEEAVTFWKRLIREDPYDFSAYARLADYYCMNQEFAAAKELLEQVREKVQRDHGALWSIAKIYHKIGEYQLAKDILKKLCQFDSKFFDFHNTLADIYLKEYNFVQAYEYIEQAIKIEPFNHDIQFKNLLVKAKLSHTEFFEVLEQVIQIHPSIVLRTLEEDTFKHYHNDSKYKRIVSLATERKQYLSKIIFLNGSEFSGNQRIRRMHYKKLNVIYNYLKLLGFSQIVFYFDGTSHYELKFYTNYYNKFFSQGIIQEVKSNNASIYKMLPIIAQMTDGLIISNTEFHRYTSDKSIKPYLEKNQIIYTLNAEGLFLQSDYFTLSEEYYKEILYEAIDILYGEK